MLLNSNMLHVYLSWVMLVLTCCYSALGFPSQNQPAEINTISEAIVPYPFQGLENDETIRSVYDPGEDPFKASPSLIESNDYDNMIVDSENSDKVVLKSLEDKIQEDQEIAAKSALLLKLLEDPSLQTLPVVYVESEENIEGAQPMYQSSLQKRSRYYRRYPWKRQNSRHRTYEADTRYLCVPSREDVFKLLVGLHENRNGNHQKTVSFCNRKRPAKAIFTNIRFLG